MQIDAWKFSPIRNLQKLFCPRILKILQGKWKNIKNSKLDLGQNPVEIVHGPLELAEIPNKYKHVNIEKKA